MLIKKNVLFMFSFPPETFPYDISTKSGLAALYKMRVFKATRYKRLLRKWAGLVTIPEHIGVVVTLEDGWTFLVHKVIVTMFSWVVTYHCQISSPKYRLRKETIIGA